MGWIVKAGTWESSWTSTATQVAMVMDKREWKQTDPLHEHGLSGPAETVQAIKADRSVPAEIRSTCLISS